MYNLFIKNMTTYSETLIKYCYMPTTIETIETLVLQNIITPVCRRLILDILLMRDKTRVSVLSTSQS